MKLIRAAIPLLVLFFLYPALANAQGRVDAYFGMGAAHDGSGPYQDLFGTGTSYVPNSMGGVFGTIGGGFMFKPSLGVGAEVSLRFAQGDYYTGVGYRPIFYDFNGIWTPSFGTKRVMPEIQAGFGGLSLRFYAGAPTYNPYTGSSSNFAGSFSHIQLHTSFGLRVYVKEHIYVRPQFDYHWVHGLSDQFKSDSVTVYTIAVGYSF